MKTQPIVLSVQKVLWKTYAFVLLAIIIETLLELNQDVEPVRKIKMQIILLDFMNNEFPNVITVPVDELERYPMGLL